jgi:hypothetical protein
MREHSEQSALHTQEQQAASALGTDLRGSESGELLTAARADPGQVATEIRRLMAALLHYGTACEAVVDAAGEQDRSAQLAMSAALKGLLLARAGSSES